MKMTFSIIPRDDPRQALRIRRTLLAIGMAGIHLFTSCAMYYRGLFRFSFTGFVLFSLALWIGHFSIFTIIRTGLNKRFADQSLTFVQIFWAATCVMLTAYFLNGLRPVVLMLFLVAMLFGFLRLNFREFMYLSLYAIILYGVVIGLLARFHPEFIDTDKEIIVWFSFSLVSFCFALMGREINHMREKLQTQNIQLREEIGERKRAQEEAQLRKAFFEGLVDNMPDAIAIFDDAGIITEINLQFTRTFGYSDEEAAGQNISDLVGPKDRLEEAHSFRQRIVSGEIIDVETVRKSKDGAMIDVSLRSTPVIVDNNRIGHLVIYRDISPRKQAETEKARLESKLQEAKKMEAIGTLAGGIAHDYNNLLAVIMGNLSMAQEEAQPHSAMVELLHEIEQASYKARDLTHQFLTLSQGGYPRKEPGSVESLLKEISGQVQAHDGIEYTLSIQDDLWPLRYDSRQLHFAISNVLINAVEAIPQGGTITLRAENQVIENQHKESALPLMEGRYVRISIKDEGRGIAGKHLSRIFDPYFSTKERGAQKGMGMGLSTAYAVVQKHGGHIEVNSTIDVGTTVIIYLPVAEEKGKEKSAKQVSNNIAPSISSGQPTIKRILVMDDEESLRNLAQKMLERLVYEVETVKDGAEAIETYKKHMDSGEPFDGVILDLTIKGGMGGDQAVKELLKIDPDAKAIVCSGYFNDPVMSDFEKFGFMGALAKPYEKEALKEVLERLSE